VTAPRRSDVEKKIEALERRLDVSERDRKISDLKNWIEHALDRHPKKTIDSIMKLIEDGLATTSDLRSISARNVSYTKFKGIFDHIVASPIEGINLWGKIDRKGAGRNRHTYWIDILKHGKLLGLAIDGYKKVIRYPDARAQTKSEKIDYDIVFLDSYLCKKVGIHIAVARKACEELNRLFVRKGEAKCLKRLSDGRWAVMY
jgi:hypothetical protein